MKKRGFGSPADCVHVRHRMALVDWYELGPKAETDNRDVDFVLAHDHTPCSRLARRSAAEPLGEAALPRSRINRRSQGHRRLVHCAAWICASQLRFLGRTSITVKGPSGLSVPRIYPPKRSDTTGSRTAGIPPSATHTVAIRMTAQRRYC